MSYCYMIEAKCGMVKIGCSDFPRVRLETTKTHSPVPVRLIAQWPGDNHHERGFHKRFSEAKRISEEAAALIDRLQSLRAALKPKAVA